MGTKSYSEETTRLHEEINRLKKEKGAVILTITTQIPRYRMWPTS